MYNWKQNLEERYCFKKVSLISLCRIQLGVMESKMAIEGRSMNMILGPNKAAVAKLQAQAQSAGDKTRGSKAQEGEKTEVPKSEAPASV